MPGVFDLLKGCRARVAGLVLVTLAGGGMAGAAPITDFTSWTLTQDPPNALMNGLSTITSATLTAGNGAVPAGTDVGFASVNGTTPAGSSGGNYFAAGSSFSLAVTYNLQFTGSTLGGLALGFGVGEDSTGVDSAGVTLGTVFGSPVAFLGTARTNDATLSPLNVGASNALQGTMFVSVNGVNGDVTVGASSVVDALAPQGTATFSNLLASWDNTDLIASFFIRSDNPSTWNGASASAAFSNFRVLSGAPVPVPEPSALALLLLGGAACWTGRSVRRRG
jgi:hypothetical protein